MIAVTAGPGTNGIDARYARFLVAGTLNTAASDAVYLLRLNVADYRVACGAAYVAGLAGGYWANARFVFGATLAAVTATG